MPNPDLLRKSLEARMPEALDLLERMVALNSFTGNAAGVDQLGRLTAESFAPLGFVPEFLPSTNPEWGKHLLMQRVGTSSANIALVSHLDTVFTPEEEQRNDFRWHREGDRIYGPGTSDIKGGTVMMWLILDCLREHMPDLFNSITWKLFWNSSEEQSSTDFGELCRKRFNEHTRAALVFEGEGREAGALSVVSARKGRAEWRVDVSGRGAHAGVKHLAGANAVVQLAKTIQQIAALTDYSRHLTFNVSGLSGGTVLNRVPHHAWAEGEFRAFDPQTYAAAKAALLDLAGPGEICSPMDGYRCQVEVKVLGEGRPWPRNTQTDELSELWRRTGDNLGIKVAPEERGGVSDGNFLWDAVPTLDGLGPYGDNDHCSERSPDGSKLPEFVQVSSFVPKALLNVMAIARLLEG